MSMSLPPDYRPSDEEEFMNPLQIEYFRQKLLRWRAELVADSSGTLRHLKEESLLKPDLTDRARIPVSSGAGGVPRARRDRRGRFVLFKAGSERAGQRSWWPMPRAPAAGQIGTPSAGSRGGSAD